VRSMAHKSWEVKGGGLARRSCMDRVRSGRGGRRGRRANGWDPAGGNIERERELVGRLDGPTSDTTALSGWAEKREDGHAS
jgi:hypothetical protein